MKRRSLVALILAAVAGLPLSVTTSQNPAKKADRGRVRHFVSVPEVADAAMAGAGSRESFIAADLVSSIDRRYRTHARSESRGIAGHSMGGYGALRAAIKHPNTFSVVYALSPCCIQPVATITRRTTKADAVRGFEDVAAADFFTKAEVAGAAAWSPNPKRPPLFLDLLVRNGQADSLIAAKWNANGILATADQHISKVRQLRAIALDAGDEDSPGIPEDARSLSELLASYGTSHSFEIYPGTHVSGIADRLRSSVLPLFWKHLEF